MKYVNFRLFIGLLAIAFGLFLFLGISISVTDGDYNENMSDVSFFGFAFIFCFLPFAVIGALLVWNGLRRAESAREIDQQQKLLNITAARARIALTDLARELKVTPERAKDLLYIVVGRKQFTGHINWNEGILYSDEADELLARQSCMHCGGRITIAGKGVVVCQFCGTEIFVSG